jgi:predicted NAD-dependent protein-ADP-ribosyltransferase YbiA (DUF1768 family)
MPAKRDVFMRILRSKFKAPELKAALMGTGDRYLIEFCRGAKRREVQLGKGPERWGGLDEEQGDGTWRIYGRNAMGHFLMSLRKELQQTVL